MKGSVRLDCRRQPGKPLDTLVDTRLAYQHRIRQPLQVHDKPAYRVGIVAVAGEECQRRRHPVLELDPVEPAQRVVHRLGVLLAGVIGIGDLAERLRPRPQHTVDESSEEGRGGKEWVSTFKIWW